MTTDPDMRVQQFRRMVEADPDNELGHFSLGKAYLEAERFDEAAVSLARAVELNPKLSKAYELLGLAHDRAGHREMAIEAVTRGVTIADEQGDRMPREAMADLLSSWGAPLPTLKAVRSPSPDVQATDSSTTGFCCARCGSPTGGQLDKSPFKGPLGDKVFAQVCGVCWREWVATGTKVINELGLVLSSQVGQDTYDQYMIEFLQLQDR